MTPALATVTAGEGGPQASSPCTVPFEAFTTAMHLTLVLTWNTPIVPC